MSKRKDQGRTFVVTVTEEDVAHGRRHDCYACPVARAIGRAMVKRGLKILVGGIRSSQAELEIGRRFGDSMRYVRWRLPHDVAAFARDFDDGKAYTLPAPFALAWPWDGGK